MRGREIVAALNERRTEQHCFVKWWRKEEDFLDYDLIAVELEMQLGVEAMGARGAGDHCLSADIAAHGVDCDRRGPGHRAAKRQASGEEISRPL